MRKKTDIFTINGLPVPAPDADVAIACTDVEAMEPVRDQDGLLHRRVIRSGLRHWTFRYSGLSEEERQYLEGLFPADGGTFLFGHPDPGDLSRQGFSTCYREDYTISLRNAAGEWAGCSFRIGEV